MGIFNFGGGKAATTFRGTVATTSRGFDTGIVSIDLKVRNKIVSLTFAAAEGNLFWSESFGKKNMVLEVTVTSDNPDVITAYRIVSHQ